jgi:tRNA threonylcarbamoyladenosine biosynthesis protein TsaE
MKNKLSIHILSVSDLPKAANDILQFSNENKIFCFDAPMGAGKTTLVKYLCAALKCAETVSSPTYPIINQYNGKENIYHIDCYRLKNVNEAMHIGMEEFFYSNNYCFIEWAEIVKEILPSEYVKISIEILGENERQIIAELIEQ